MNGREKRRLQRCLEDLYCNECDICICPCGCSSNVAVDICDCCVNPMEQFLVQVHNLLSATGTITLSLVNGSDYVVFQNQNITTIQDGILTGTDNNGDVNSVAICQISMVATNDAIPLTATQINLLSAPNCTCGECDCCEKPVREKLSTYSIGSPLIIEFEISGEKTEVEAFQKVGLGIALTLNGNNQLVAYSTCKITNIREVVV